VVSFLLACPMKEEHMGKNTSNMTKMRNNLNNSVEYLKEKEPPKRWVSK
jgi:hypothetical protein